MTSKDYKLLVKVIRQTRYDSNGNASVQFNLVADKVISRLLVNLCNALKVDNKRFDEDVFYDAVYGKEEVK